MIDNLGSWVFFFAPSQRIYGILWSIMVSAALQRKSIFVQ